MNPNRGLPPGAARWHDRSNDPGGASPAPSSSAREMRRLLSRLTSKRDGFFSEPPHFADLQRRLFAMRAADGEHRVWSAGCGSGEEAYSIAMLLADKLGERPWTVIGTDWAAARMAEARRALYPLERARLIPEAYLTRCCLRGTGAYEGYLLIGPELRARVQFIELDLREALPHDWPCFDTIFLRHALRGFDRPTRAAVVQRVLAHLKADGVIYTGHGESLAALDVPLRQLAPAIHVRA